MVSYVVGWYVVSYVGETFTRRAIGEREINLVVLKIWLVMSMELSLEECLERENYILECWRHCG